MKTVPANEIANRLAMMQALLTKNSVAAAVIRQNSDLFYFTGTVQDGHLIIPASGNPVFLVRRSLERAHADSPIRPIIPLKSLIEVRQALFDACGTDEPEVIGFELDVLPANMFFLYDEKIFPRQRITDISNLVRQMRMIKSPWEIGMLREAAKVSIHVQESVPNLLRPGKNELVLMAELEAIARIAGNTGFVRARSFNIEMSFGHILSGPHAAVPSYTDAPTGGPGITPSFGQGAGDREIREGEVVSVDLAICKDGYLNDITRNYCIGPPPQRLAKAYEFAKTAHSKLREHAGPGSVAGDIYRQVLAWAEEAGWAKWFMGHADPKISFVGHGVGIEMDEFPFIAEGHKLALAEGMVFAFEPKVIIPGEGIAGLENTYLVTSSGIESLTPISEEMVIV